MRLVPCVSCGSKNRLPRFYLKGTPVCGRCGAGLPESVLQRLARGAYRRWGWILVRVDAVLRRRQALPVGGTTARQVPVGVSPEPTVHRQEQEQEELERRLRAAILDAGARQRLLEAKRARHPEMPQAALIKLVLEDYERDRR